MLRETPAMQSAETPFSRRERACPASGRLLRILSLAIILSGPLTVASTGHAAEPGQRLFPTAPTDYRRSRSMPQPLPSSPVSPGNAEADIPQGHLLYSLHAPPHSSVIQQAGGRLENTVTSGTVATGVVPAGGLQEVVPVDENLTVDRLSESVFIGHFRPDTESEIEHIPAAAEWTGDLSLSSDLNRAWRRLRDDTSGVLHPHNLLLFGLAGGGAVALRQNVDERVRHYTATHPKHWDTASDVFGELGYVTVQIPVLLGSYYWSLHTQNRELHDLNATLFSAFTINGTGTLLIKAAANTDRPSENFNGGKFGFPSYHASSSFTIASVLDEYYGHRVGVPAYALAGVIAWSRVNSRDHDLSDVVFGSAMGFVIGKSVARHHLVGDSRVQILPWFEPIGGTSGLRLSMNW